MKRAAKKVSRKNKTNPVTKVVPLAIGAGGDTIVKGGDIEPGTNGDIRIAPGDSIQFEYTTGTQTFALLVLRFTPNPGQGGGPNETPFGARVYLTSNGTLNKKIKSAAKKGRYQYALALLDGSGRLITADPQIIVQ